MPPELTNGQIHGHADALLNDAMEHTEELSSADRYRVMDDLRIKIGDYLETQTYPDGPKPAA